MRENRTLELEKLVQDPEFEGGASVIKMFTQSITEELESLKTTLIEKERQLLGMLLRIMTNFLLAELAIGQATARKLETELRESSSEDVSYKISRCNIHIRVGKIENFCVSCITVIT